MPGGDGAGPATAPTRTPHLAALLLLVGLYIASALLAAPARPSVMTDFFASRTLGRPVTCSPAAAKNGTAAPQAPPGDPAACAAGRAAAVAWGAGTDFLANCALATALAPALGSASDASRRRVPFLAAGLAAGALPPLALAAHLTTGASLLLYFPASALATALPGAALIFAYVADALPPASRAGGFGAVGGALWAGVIAGSLAGGALPPAAAAAASAVGTAGLAAVAAVALPETLGRRQAGPAVDAAAAEEAAAGPAPPPPPPPPTALRALRAAALSPASSSSNPYAGLAILGRSRLYGRLTAIIILTGAVADGSSEILAQFLQGRVVGGFGPARQGTLLAALGGSSLAAQAVVLPALLGWCRVGEPAVLGLGLVGAVVQCVGLAAWTAPSARAAVALVAAAGGLSSLAAPAIAALKANAAGDDEQGAVQGALAGARALAAGVGPVLFAAAFWAGGRPGKDSGGGGGMGGGGGGAFPGAPYALGAVLSMLALRLCRGVAGDAAAVAAVRGTEGGGPAAGGQEGGGDEQHERWARAGAAERVALLIKG